LPSLGVRRLSQFISFREEDLCNFSQSEHIIDPGSHVEYPTGTKNSNFVEDHPRNIPAKFGSMAATTGHRLTLDPMGKCSNVFFSETTNMIKAKLYMNVHLMVLYKL
jgi:hypothetical protein